MKSNSKWLNPATQGGKILPEYDQWKHLRERCREAYHVKFPHYFGVSCCKKWESYDEYVTWARSQIGFLSRDTNGRVYALDKDILIEGNKVYCPEHCVFVPQGLNNFITLGNKIRGKYLLGVSKYNGSDRFMAQVNDGQKKNLFLGSFNSELEAHEAYLNAKKEIARQLATKYEGLVDPRVIQRLRNFNLTLGATQ